MPTTLDATVTPADASTGAGWRIQLHDRDILVRRGLCFTPQVYAQLNGTPVPYPTGFATYLKAHTVTVDQDGYVRIDRQLAGIVVPATTTRGAHAADDMFALAALLTTDAPTTLCGHEATDDDAHRCACLDVTCGDYACYSRHLDECTVGQAAERAYS